MVSFLCRFKSKTVYYSTRFLVFATLRQEIAKILFNLDSHGTKHTRCASVVDGKLRWDKTSGFFAGVLGYAALLVLCTVAYTLVPAFATPTYAAAIVVGLICLAPAYLLKKRIEPRFPDFACTVMAGSVTAALILAYLSCWSISLHAVNPHMAWYLSLMS